MSVANYDILLKKKNANHVRPNWISKRVAPSGESFQENVNYPSTIKRNGIFAVRNEMHFSSEMFDASKRRIL